MFKNGNRKYRLSSCVIAVSLIIAMLAMQIPGGIFVPAAAESAEEGVIEGDYDFSSTGGTYEQITDHFVYRDDCFMQSSYDGCSHLMVLSSKVMLASFSRYGNYIEAKGKGIDCAENILDMLTAMGFSDVCANEYYNSEKLENSVGIALGSKTIKAGGKEYTLIAIVPRSSGYKQEWAGNFTVGDGDVHEGFKEARDEALRFVNQYIKDNDIKGSLKIWTVGHSRGGAIANMIAGFFAGGGIAYFGDEVSVEPEDVYGYSFASPVCIKDGAKLSEVLSVSGARGDAYAADTPGHDYVSSEKGEVDLSDDKYDGIRTFISENDVVPMLPPAEWGFSRYGSVLSADDDGNTTFEDAAAALNELNPFVGQLFEKGDYRKFKAKTLGFTFMLPTSYSEGAPASYSEFIKSRVLAMIAEAKTNELYVSGGYQDGMAAVAGLFGMFIPGGYVASDSGESMSVLAESGLAVFLAYAAEKMTASDNSLSEDEAVASVLAQTLNLIMESDLDTSSTVDDVVYELAVYISENSLSVPAIGLKQAIASSIPAEYEDTVIDILGKFHPDYFDRELSLEDIIDGTIEACAYGSDVGVGILSKHFDAADVRKALYNVLGIVLADSVPDIKTIIGTDKWGIADGSATLTDTASYISSTLRSSGGYDSLSTMADARLAELIEKALTPSIDHGAGIYGDSYAEDVTSHMESVKANIGSCRTILLDFVFATPGEDFSVDSCLKNAVTLYSSAAIIPASHAGETYTAWAVAAGEGAFGFADHASAGEENNSSVKRTDKESKESNKIIIIIVIVTAVFTAAVAVVIIFLKKKADAQLDSEFEQNE
ncbi:MAG: lipase family protein [Lachnospiraceae bacterium]|nr:lipase family protein [Lachnospiraceae bacterium]